MNIVKGMIVKSKAGHDSGGFFIVTSVTGGFATICDGKRRSIEKQKRKKLIHLCPTEEIVGLDTIKTNREIKRLLHKYNYKQGQGLT